MRAHIDADIMAQATQPDIPYIGTSQLIDVAVSLNYTYDDYVFFAKACGREVYSATIFQSYKDCLAAQEADILEKHW